MKLKMLLHYGELQPTQGSGPLTSCLQAAPGESKFHEARAGGLPATQAQYGVGPRVSVPSVFMEGLSLHHALGPCWTAVTAGDPESAEKRVVIPPGGTPAGIPYQSRSRGLMTVIPPDFSKISLVVAPHELKK